MSVNGKFITATMVTTTQVGYDHDTYGGASGSPVLGHSDDAVIAIHNLGNAKDGQVEHLSSTIVN